MAEAILEEAEDLVAEVLTEAALVAVSEEEVPLVEEPVEAGKEYKKDCFVIYLQGSFFILHL